ncbi:MAG: acylphosphatase [Planctomycetaceae bacterium]|jgi:acylphosphatase|nr:acylphosphatase [Planctomycetaceae bacterium]MBP63225.1 acylphosphatase [Planctomycetaceae bacterium]
MVEKQSLARREVYYQGRVQGVGFRWKTQNIARQFDVQGYVSNQPDGRVKLVGEGRPDELKRFLASITETMSQYIDCEQVVEQSPQGEFTTFDIQT